MRLIDADALVEKIEECWDVAQIQTATRRTGKTLWCVFHGGVNYCRNLVLDAPTIEAEPEQEGVWIYAPSGEALGGTDATYDYKCSLCGEYSVEGSKYCPNCGKKMKSGFIWKKDFLEAPKEEA